VVSAWGQAEFQEGRDVRSPGDLYVYMGCPFDQHMGQAQLCATLSAADYKYLREGQRTDYPGLDHGNGNGGFPFSYLLSSSFLLPQSFVSELKSTVMECC
jgi:hypothetical protein